MIEEMGRRRRWRSLESHWLCFSSLVAWLGGRGGGPRKKGNELLGGISQEQEGGRRN